jgi:hypothetical protein
MEREIESDLAGDIEVTLAMMKAGLDALDGELLDGYCSSRPELVRAVFRAMANRSDLWQSRQ